MRSASQEGQKTNVVPLVPGHEGRGNTGRVTRDDDSAEARWYNCDKFPEYQGYEFGLPQLGGTAIINASRTASIKHG